MLTQISAVLERNDYFGPDAKVASYVQLLQARTGLFHEIIICKTPCEKMHASCHCVSFKV